MSHKKCSQCGEVKEVSEFYKRPDRPGKYRSGCKICKRAADNKQYAKNRERKIAWQLAYQKRNPHIATAIANKRRSAKLNRTPRWLTDTDDALIKAKYRVATCLGLQVDHIMPLQGKLVSGLHVPDNLQLLTPTANRQKSNKWEV